MLERIVVEFSALLGFAALIALLVNVAKFFGWIKDGDALYWTSGANFVVIITMYALKLFKPEFDFANIDPIVAEIAAVGTMLFQLISGILASRLTHYAVKGLPVIGKSFTQEREQYLG